jgi:hypothetical protein
MIPPNWIGSCMHGSGAACVNQKLGALIIILERSINHDTHKIKGSRNPKKKKGNATYRTSTKALAVGQLKINRVLLSHAKSYGNPNY